MHFEYSLFFFTDKNPCSKIENRIILLFFLSTGFFVQVYLVFTTNYFPWLTIIVVFPILAGSFIFFLPHRGNKVIRWYTICICILELLLTTYTFCSHFQLDDPLTQLAEDYKWINFFDFYWRLGIDGLSIGPILLTGFITTLATLAARPITRDSRLFHFLMLAMYSGQIGLFSSRDLLLFFIMWELELIPVYLLLSMWGGKKRLYSATKFILYTAGGSIFLLIGVLGIGLYGSNEPTLNYETLANQSYPAALEIIFYIGFLIAFAVKSPIIPLHTWLPDTHGEAHYSTCMLLAGILLKMGAYGLVRINMEFLPHAHSLFSPWLITIGAIQIIYAASTSPGQRNLKKRIAYSSISHMGFIIIGIGSITDTGLNGAILQIISHGFIGAALFFLAGTSYDRIRLLYLDEMGGMAIPLPKIFTMFSILSMASLALPGMSGFVAELLVFFGIITSQKYLLMPKILVTFLMAIGMILTPIYLLSMIRQMFYGYKLFNVPNYYFFDSGPRELFVSISILLPIIGIGIYPDFVLSLSVDKVEAIISNFFYQ
uniref:NAD(P)H-quinone oxidoreductase chain 4, chloroplastic n=1 Tax=Lagerstroemia balansae TaxID=2778913 RepID=A0A7L9CWN4_9MYRT|nr:NADH-plastoquinone oxidoreductase subunit 4 [Lagerstroemia balansae]QOJ46201.1 NADH-plastoquinone oxidoreductase subunit 4 [Lagerstroemia balansae]